jgi:hypothetical protein
MLNNYEILFMSKPKEFATPIMDKDHLEIDTSALLDALGIKQFQSLIGVLQWLFTLGRFDIHLGVYRCAPRQGHLDRFKRMYDYLRFNPSGAICFRVTIPNHKYLATLFSTS